jgi:hypothetical protein
MSNPNEETGGRFAASTPSRFSLDWMTCSDIGLFPLSSAPRSNLHRRHAHTTYIGKAQATVYNAFAKNFGNRKYTGRSTRVLADIPTSRPRYLSPRNQTSRAQNRVN